METQVQAFEIDALVVDPSHAQAAVLRKALNELGVNNVTEAYSGQQALDCMHRQAISLVLSSFYLPDMSGAQLVKSMRDDHDLQDVQFILVSSEERDTVIDDVRQAGVCGLLHKPFREEELLAALNVALDMLSEKSSDDSFMDLDLRALVVDDMPSSRRFIRKVLEHVGITDVQEANNGRNAIPLVEQSAFDLIITDYNMPEMDGRQFVEYVRTESWQANVPILMVTSEHNEGRLSAVHDAGVSEICDKPFNPDTLRQQLHRLLQVEEV